jgi:23S rRNA pseudouridine1911/1915/1917 synthase
MRVVVGAAGRADKLLLDGLGEGNEGSRRLVAQAFAEGRVHLNGRRARKGDAVVAGDVLELEGEVARAALAPEPEPFRPLAVLFEDEHLVAVAKPPGIPSCPLRAGERGTLANALAARYPECVAAGADPREAGLAHRLDGGTSGLLLAARSAEVWRALRVAFRDGAVRKEYLALVEGAVEERQVVDVPIAHDRSGAGGVRAGERPGALPATTEILPERRLGRYTLVRCVTRSGRMHQVRVHLAFIGHPCVGDLRYGAPATYLTTDGAFLHAGALQLVHPVTKRPLSLHAPWPPERAVVVSSLT